jgi:transcriptional regulator with XRE-family HTH domain
VRARRMISLGVLADSTAESVGARLKRLRLERGFSQRDLSSQGVTYAYISRIEAGARTPSVKALRKLARKLGVSVEYLETGSELREVDDRSIRLAEAELEVRLASDTSGLERKLDAIFDEALDAGDTGSAARAKAALGLLSARHGRHLEVLDRLEPIVAKESAPPPHLRPDVYCAVGEAYAALGAPERAVRLLEDCLASVRADVPEDVDVEIRYSSLLGRILAGIGETRRAAEGVLPALGRARERGDHDIARVRAYWSLGRRCLEQGRPAEAADYLRDAAALIRARDHDAARSEAAEAVVEWADALPDEDGNGRSEAIRARAYDLRVGVEARPTGLS